MNLHKVGLPFNLTKIKLHSLSDTSHSRHGLLVLKLKIFQHGKELEKIWDRQLVASYLWVELKSDCGTR